MNIIAVVCARDLKDRELCGGFMASKGFEVVNVSRPLKANTPMAVLADSIGRVKDVATAVLSTFKAAPLMPRLIVIQVAKKTDRKPKLVSEVYPVIPSRDKTKLFLALEAIIRKERDISRGSKPKCRISIPV